MTDTRSKVLILPADLHTLMGTPSLVLLAVQSISPYTGKSSVTGTRIPGAVDAEAFSDFAGVPTPTSGHRPLPRIEDLQAALRRWGVARESTVVLYDNDRSLTAARGWWVLRWAGIEDVRVLDGGFGAWQAAGLPVSSEIPVQAPSTIAITGGHMPVMDADASAAMARDAILLDARIRPNYIGGEVPAGQPARGHIPGAISAPAPDNVTDYGNFTDGATLRTMYEALGADGARPVGVYCGAGMSAAHTVLALASIGIEAAMYPGSWSAWITDPARPVVRGARPR